MDAPNIRFKEFHDSWKSEVIGKVSKIFDGTHQTPIYQKEGIKFLSVENINDLNNSEKYVLEKDYNKHKAKPEYGDIFMTRIGSVGVTNIFKSSEKFSYYVSLALIKPIGINSEYLNQAMKTEFFQREIWKRTIHVAFPKKINLGDISKCQINYPSIEEQNKIASFLSLLARRIELQETKINKLELYKKGIMQKIFSQDIRFKDASGEEYPVWEEKKMCQLLHERNIKTTLNDKYEHVSLTKEGVVPKNARYERDFLVRQNDKKYKITKINDICYNPANLKFGVICRNKYNDAVFSPIYVTYEVFENYSPIFLEYYLCRKEFINKVRKYEEGTVYERMAVKSSDFLKYKNTFPNKNEQDKIASFLSSIDLKIDKEQKLKRYLEEFKNGLLQKMFI